MVEIWIAVQCYSCMFCLLSEINKPVASDQVVVYKKAIKICIPVQRIKSHYKRFETRRWFVSLAKPLSKSICNAEKKTNRNHKNNKITYSKHGEIYKDETDWMKCVSMANAHECNMVNSTTGLFLFVTLVAVIVRIVSMHEHWATRSFDVAIINIYIPRSCYAHYSVRSPFCTWHTK